MQLEKETHAIVFVHTALPVIRKLEKKTKLFLMEEVNGSELTQVHHYGYKRDGLTFT